MRLSAIAALILGATLTAGFAAEPVKALEDYFKAINKLDTNLLSSAVHAPDGYKTEFVRVIEVARRLRILDDLLATKYKVRRDHRHNVSQYLGTLSPNLKTATFVVNGDRARSGPSASGEVPVLFVRVGDDWQLDLVKDQTAASLAKQAEHLKKVYDAVISLLNGLIYKIDTLDTEKFSYEEAWKMVSIQVQRKVSSLVEKKGEPDGGANGSQPNRSETNREPSATDSRR